MKFLNLCMVIILNFAIKKTVYTTFLIIIILSFIERGQKTIVLTFFTKRVNPETIEKR